MSAAGIQSEIATVTLASVARHQASYVRQVDTLRQKLESRIRQIHRDEVRLHKSIATYAQKLEDERLKLRKEALRRKVARSNSTLNRMQLAQDDPKSSKRVQFERAGGDDAESGKSTGFSEPSSVTPSVSSTNKSTNSLTSSETGRNSPTPASVRRHRKRTKMKKAKILQDIDNNGDAADNYATNHTSEHVLYDSSGVTIVHARAQRRQLEHDDDVVDVRHPQVDAAGSMHGRRTVQQTEHAAFMAAVRGKQEEVYQAKLLSVNDIIHRGRHVAPRALNSVDENDEDDGEVVVDNHDSVVEVLPDQDDISSALNQDSNYATKNSSTAILAATNDDADVTHKCDVKRKRVRPMTILTTCKLSSDAEPIFVLPKLIQSVSEPTDSKDKQKPTRKSKSLVEHSPNYRHSDAPKSRRQSLGSLNNNPGDKKPLTWPSTRYNSVKDAFMKDGVDNGTTLSKIPPISADRIGNSNYRRRPSLSHADDIATMASTLTDADILRRLGKERDEAIRAKGTQAHMRWVHVMGKIRECHHLVSDCD